MLLCGWTKCAAAIGSNRVTWYKINFTTDYTQTHAVILLPRVVNKFHLLTTLGNKFGTWAIFPQPREINLTSDLDASHYLYNVFVVIHSKMHEFD